MESAHPNKSKTALVIGDDESIPILGSMLASAGLNTSSVPEDQASAKLAASPDLAVVLFFIGGLRSLLTIRKFRTVNRQVFIIGLIVSDDDDGFLCDAYEAGSDIVFAGPPSPKAIKNAISRFVLPYRPTTAFQKLTSRELEVLTLITAGRSTKDTARDLGISYRTVEVHRARVMEKFMARNSLDLARIVWQERYGWSEEN
jgi:DNA-binding NarL/FixJ family response regulator